MQLSDMISAIDRLVDDTIDQQSAIDWLNAGMHIMEMQVNATFPEIDGVTVLTYPFPVTYHRIPVLYAATKFLEQSVMLDQSMNYYKQFQDQLGYFVEKYDVPPQYQNDPRTQQFVATAGQLAFVITNNSYDPATSRLSVYVNNRQTIDWSLVTNPTYPASQAVTTLYTTSDPNGVVFNPTTVLNTGDFVTMSWEEHADFVEPPYSFWSW